MSTQKVKIIKDTASLNIALVISQVLSILQSFVIMRFLDPAMYGVWLGFMILLNYASFVHLGITYGMVIRMLFHKGQGNEEAVQKIQDTGFTVWTGLAVAFSLGVLVYLFFIPNVSAFQKCSFVIISILIILEQQITFLIQWQSSYLKDFKLVSLGNIYRAVLSFVLFVPLAYFYNVIGVMIGSLCVSGFITIYWWRKTTYRPRIRFHFASLWEVMRIGFPILLVVLGGVVIQNVDRLVILNMLGTVFLGYYGITALGGSSVYSLLGQAGSSIAPHMIEDFGRNNESAPALHKYLTKPTLIFSYFAVFLISGLLLFVPFIVELVLPRYIPGINAFYIMIPGYFFLSIILTANNILNVMLAAYHKQRFVIYIQAAAILIEIGLSILFVRIGWGIEGVALASTITSAFYGLSILYATSYYVIPDLKQRLAFVGSIMLPFLYALVFLPAALWLGKQIIHDNKIIRFTIQCVLTLVFYLPMFYYLNRKSNIVKEFAPFVQGIRKKFGRTVKTEEQDLTV